VAELSKVAKKVTKSTGSDTNESSGDENAGYKGVISKSCHFDMPPFNLFLQRTGTRLLKKLSSLLEVMIPVEMTTKRA
jgi:hypothetical protein